MKFDDFIHEYHEKHNADEPFMDDVERFEDYLADLDVDDWLNLGEAYAYEVVKKRLDDLSIKLFGK